MNTAENNKLIAEFMGVYYNENDETYYSNCCELDSTMDSPRYITDDPTELKFHTSWDWLMPVIDKCYELTEDDEMMEIVTHLQVIDMNNTHKAVVEFIKWYNKSK
jgi:hypothetical protein